MLMSRLFLSGAIAACAVLPVQAQDLTTGLSASFIEPVPQKCLTMEAALKLSSENDPGVELALAFEDEAEAVIGVARSLSRPQISAIARSGFGETGIAGAGVSNSFGLQASQRIFDFGDAKLAKRSAEAERDSAQFDTEQARISAVIRAGSAFIDRLEAIDQLVITQERVTYFQTLLDATDRALVQGGATRTERAAVASQLADARAFVLELEFRRDQATSTLLTLTASTHRICDQLSPSIFGSVSRFANSDDAFSAAIAMNPALRAAKRRADAAEASSEREARARLPIINVVATGAYSSFGGFDNFGVRERIGIDVSVPLYSGGSLTARKRQARAQASAARARIRDEERRLRLDIEIGLRRILSLEERLVQRREVKTQTALQLDAAEIERNAGTQTLRELVEIRLEFEAASLRVNQARFELERERLNLLALLGELGTPELF